MTVWALLEGTGTLVSGRRGGRVGTDQIEAWATVSGERRLLGWRSFGPS